MLAMLPIPTESMSGRAPHSTCGAPEEVEAPLSWSDAAVATVEAVESIFIDAWWMGLKSIAVYRQGRRSASRSRQSRPEKR
jgi:ribonucleotide reductase alpha subunit